MNDPYFSAYFRPRDHRILKSRGHAFPPLQPVLRARRPVQSYVPPPVPALAAFGSQGPLPSECYSGLRGGGRSRGPAGSGGEGGGSASVTLAEDGGGAAAAPLPGKKRARCGSAPAASWEETCAPPTNTNTQPRPRSSVPSPPSELQLCVPLRLPARRRRPISARRAAPRPQRPGRPRWRGTSSRLAHSPLRLPGFGLPFDALRLFRAARPRLCLRTEWL